MNSSQQAVIALINRSTMLLAELNQTRRTNRDLERRLDQALARIAELEGGPLPLAAGALSTPALAASVLPAEGGGTADRGAPVLAAGVAPLTASLPLRAPMRPVAGDWDFAA